jgi:hypothetical protein
VEVAAWALVPLLALERCTGVVTGASVDPLDPLDPGVPT